MPQSVQVTKSASHTRSRCRGVPAQPTKMSFCALAIKFCRQAYSFQKCFALDKVPDCNAPESDRASLRHSLCSEMLTFSNRCRNPRPTSNTTGLFSLQRQVSLLRACCCGWEHLSQGPVSPISKWCEAMASNTWRLSHGNKS